MSRFITPTTWGAFVVVAAACYLAYNLTVGDKNALASALSLVLASFGFLSMRLESILTSVRNISEKSRQRDGKIIEVLGDDLFMDDWKDCLKLFRLFKKVTHVKAPNPLQVALFQDQIQALCKFLEASDLFYDESSPYTVKDHFASFMRKIDSGGIYTATTIVNFWIDKDDHDINEFKNANRECAIKGVKIQRLFLVTEEDLQIPRTLEVLREHAHLAEEVGTSRIENKVMRVQNVDYQSDDFGIYYFQNKPRAMAVAVFEGEGNTLKGNKVTFDMDSIYPKEGLFNDRFTKKTTLDLNDFLKECS